jgi:hypothetical protein
MSPTYVVGPADPAFLPLRLGGTRQRPCGYPERFAQEALGHQSKAVHRAYARKAQVVIPTLEDYERNLAAAENVIVPLPAAVASGN